MEVQSKMDCLIGNRTRGNKETSFAWSFRVPDGSVATIDLANRPLISVMFVHHVRLSDRRFEKLSRISSILASVMLRQRSRLSD